jgi:hypothetical protein
MKLSVPSFAGMRPRVGAKYLEPSEAVLAKDCRLYSGELRPLRERKSIATLPKAGPIQSLYLFARQFWFHWAGDVDAVGTMVPGNTTSRTFWTGDGYPKQTEAGMATAGGTAYPMQSYRLGIPKPASAPSVSVPAFDPATDNETRYYVYTYVSAWDEEGPPSAASAIVTCDVDATATLSAMSAAPSGAYNINRKRIYRLSTGTDDSEFFFVAEIPVANTGYVDSVPGAQLQEPLATEGWDAPPDTMNGLIALPNGVFCGFDNKDLYFSPNYVPYAYPRRNVVSTEHKIVGLGAFNTNVVVLTEGNPYLASGVDPGAVTLSKIEVAQACVSKRSIANLGAEGVAYATPDGLALIGPGGFDMVSAKFMTQEEWREYNPSTIVAASHDNRYIAFFTRENGTKGGFVFDADNGFRELSFHATAVYADLLTDTLYLADGQQLYAYDEGAAALPYTWKSKVFQTPPASFSSARVITGAREEGDSLSLKVYADGALLHTQSVVSPDGFRLPVKQGLGREWQLELTGDVPVQEMALASSMEELN